jgi:uncharacterized protein with HEPN domain
MHEYDRELVIDVITHHYFDIDAETVFTVCDEHVPQLEKTLKTIRNDLV